MYNVVIVDDELPALRFVRSIIEQFASGFHVACAASSAEMALEHLRAHTADLLITDISMHGMNGIELAKVVRKLQPDIRIVIISGYGEFDYAQGAIQAGVDEYLLKPVSIAKMKSVLEAACKKLDSANTGYTASLLPALACGQNYDKEAVRQLYGKKNYRFAYVRFGNLDMLLPKKLGVTTLSRDEYFQILRGRDDDEQILIVEDNGTDDFLTHLSVYMTSLGNLPTWTAVYTPLFRSMESLPGFIELSIRLIYDKCVIGRHQIIQFAGGTPQERIPLPAADLKQLSYFASAGKMRLIKDYFHTLADSWFTSQMPQRQVWHMVRQIVHQVGTVNQGVQTRMEDILQEINTLIRTCGSYDELLNGTYSLMFDDENLPDHRMTTSELYESAVSYIMENYSKPLSMQSVCDELGISQTYLSRIFRKHSDTTFNAFLTQCRMEAAKKLLIDKPGLLLRDVSACVGYDDSSYFTKVFRQYTGKTPSQWADGKE